MKKVSEMVINDQITDYRMSLDPFGGFMDDKAELGKIGAICQGRGPIMSLGFPSHSSSFFMMSLDFLDLYRCRTLAMVLFPKI